MLLLHSVHFKLVPLFSSTRSYCLSYCSSRFGCWSPLLTPFQVREARVSRYFYFMRLMFCKIWEKFGENISFWYISELGVQIFMKLWYLRLFLIFWMRRAVAERVNLVAGRLCIFLICAVLVKLTFPTH